MREAARILDVSESAVHKRVRRGSIPHEKGPDGRVFVFLDGVSDGVSDSVQHPSTEALISEMRSRIGSLERQLEQEREASREMRRLLAGLIERVPQLEAPQERRDGQEEAVGYPERPESSAGNGGPQEAPERPSWWRRWFGMAG